MGSCFQAKTKSTATTGLAPYQTDINKQLASLYSGQVGAGTLGGLSNLEQSALNMLGSSDMWGPLSSAGTGLLTGTTGAKETTPEQAALAFKGSVEDPALYDWQKHTRPAIEESYSGPGYWGSARAKGVQEGASDLGNWLGSQRANWMWNADQSNKAIEEAKAGRALSALGAVPSGLGNWTSTLFGTGGAGRELLNQITDPQVLDVLYKIMGMQTQPIVTRGVKTPSEFDQWMQATNAGMKVATLAAPKPTPT